MKVILFGATGMVGKSVLRECLLSDAIESVLAIGRKPCGVSHPKLRELVLSDLYTFNAATEDLSSYDACFFCLGVSSVGKSEAEYTRITYDLTLGWAHTLARVNPTIKFLYVSGMGTGGKSMWAQVKGRTENDLLALLPNAVMVRLGGLRPMHGESSSTSSGRIMLAILTPLWPLMQLLMPKAVITSEELGRAFIAIVQNDSQKQILENADLIALGRGK